MIERAGNTVKVWNVVNEAFNEDGTLQQDCFYKISGSSYIDEAFSYAREKAPNATLVLNDFFPSGKLYKTKVDGFFSYVKAAKARGVPIDAVGTQNHLLRDGNYQFSQNYINDMAYFIDKAKDANVEVYITEMDVYQAGRGQDDVAKVYKKTTALCLNNSNCKSLTIFGVSDKYSWARFQNNEKLSNARPLLFDGTYARKPEYYGVMNAIRENSTRKCNNDPDGSILPLPTPSPEELERCYLYKDKDTCETKCGDKKFPGVFFKCRWLESSGKCAEHMTSLCGS
jgi:endo-1,4-beta-xylanase